MMSKWTFKTVQDDFSSGPVVRNPPANAGDIGSIPGPGRAIFHVQQQRSSAVKNESMDK